MGQIKKIKNLGMASLLFALMSLSGCHKGERPEDISERIHESSPAIIRWGVKVDTNLFGYYSIKNQEIEGFDIDLAKALTKKIAGPEAEAEFVEVSAKTRVPLVKNGNIDAIMATMTITDKRKQILDFSKTYFKAGQAVMVPENSSIQSLSDLDEGKIVLTVKGTTAASKIKEVAPRVKTLEMESYSEAFTALKSGQGDAMTTDNSLLLGIVTNNPGYHLVGGIYTRDPYGIAVDKGQEAWLDTINEALDELVADGSYQKIFDKWFPKDAEDSSIMTEKEE